MTAPVASSPSSALQRAWSARGPLALMLWPLSTLFAAATGLRRALYRIGVLSPERVAAPVVVVGNLIVGGAGKTPVVLALIDVLRRHGYTPGVVSRGHGGSARGVLEVTRSTSAAECGDEPLLLARRSGTPLVVGRDRVAAARQLLRAHPAVDIVLSDDGLQHLRLARDAQVLVFDERGAGNGWLLPAGPLREPLARRTPPRSVVVYNASTASTAWPGTLGRRSLSGAVGLAAWWQGEPSSTAALEALRGRALVAAAGVARPERFFAMLRERGLAFAPLALPDHHDFAELPWPASTTDVIVTEKDAIKLDPVRVGATRVWVAPLDFALDPAFDAALLALLPPPGTPRHGNAPA